MAKIKKIVNNTEKVNEFMDKLDHPFKKEVQTVRDLIKGVNKNIAEEIKWNAPSFSYKGEYLATFNLWAKQHIHLVFHNAVISKVKSKLLEGDYEGRRMAYFSDMKDIKAKKTVLEKVLKDSYFAKTKQPIAANHCMVYVEEVDKLCAAFKARGAESGRTRRRAVGLPAIHARRPQRPHLGLLPVQRRRGMKLKYSL